MALFSSLNVGGNRVQMGDLRLSFASLGIGDVETLLASGNLLFSHEETSNDVLQRRLSDHMASEFGFKSYAIVRDLAQIRAAYEQNPFRVSGSDPKFVHSFLMESEISAEGWAALTSAHTGPERVAKGERDLFVDYVDGAARSKLTLPLVVKNLGCRGTARNVNTLAKIVARLETRNTPSA